MVVEGDFWYFTGIITASLLCDQDDNDDNDVDEDDDDDDDDDDDSENVSSTCNVITAP
jgi:hypothetical protein